MKTLKSIFQRLKLRRGKLKNPLREIVRQLKEMGAIKIILFGSFAKQRTSLYSSLDILVIMPNIKSGRQWLREIYQRVGRSVASNIIVFIWEEYKESKNDKYFLERIEKEGKLIYEKKIC